MTGIRQSIIFAVEDTFMGGKGENKKWIAPPPGSFFKSVENRAVTRINATGCKTYDTLAFGPVDGSWEWSFYFDYNYLEPFYLAFESVTRQQQSDGSYVYTFKKINNGRVISGCFRRKIMNALVGGTGGDEMDDLVGALVKSVQFSRASSNSPWQITMTGIYCDSKMAIGSLPSTDYVDYGGKLSEFACLFVGDASADNYIATTDSIAITVDNNIAAVYGTCSPFAVKYHEGLTTNSFSTSCYSLDPSYYKQRLYSGGYDKTKLRPMAKGLKPIPAITIASYTKSIRDDAGESWPSVITDSENYMQFNISSCPVKSITWQRGDGSKLEDTISSSEIKDIVLKVKNSVDCDPTSSGYTLHSVTSNDPASISVLVNGTSGAFSKVYTGSAVEPAVIVTNVVSGSAVTLTKGTDYTVSYANNVNVGVATVTVDFIGAYDVYSTVSREFTITPIALTITANSKTVTVSSANAATTVITDSGFGVSGGTVPAGESVTVTVTGSQTGAGSSQNIASAARVSKVVNSTTVETTANYSITYVNGTLTIKTS